MLKIKRPEYELDSLYIEITNRCNSHCIYCYNNSGREKKNDLNLNIIKKIIKNNPHVNITLSGGEPFLHPQINEIIKFCINININTIIASNGKFINEGIIDYLRNENIVLQFSLDGATPTTNNKTRGKDDFYKTINTINKVKNKGITFKLHTVLNKYNFTEISQLKALSKELGSVQLEIVLLMKMGRAVSIYNEINCNNKISNLKEEKFKEIKNELDLSSNSVCPLFSNLDKVEISPKIDVKGDVYPCQLFNKSQYSIGNVKKMKISEIINSKQMERLYNLFQYRSYFLQDCLDCVFNGFCNKGCPGLGFEELDGFCEIRKRMFRKNLKKEKL